MPLYNTFDHFNYVHFRRRSEVTAISIYFHNIVMPSPGDLPTLFPSASSTKLLSQFKTLVEGEQVPFKMRRAGQKARLDRHTLSPACAPQKSLPCLPWF